MYVCRRFPAPRPLDVRVTSFPRILWSKTLFSVFYLKVRLTLVVVIAEYPRTEAFSCSGERTSGVVLNLASLNQKRTIRDSDYLPKPAAVK